MQDYIERSLEPVLGKAAAEFPAVILTGPRQSGKTTLLKRLFGDRCGYASLETPDVRSIALDDPRGFLDAYPPPVIFDEIQHVPDLLSYIKERIDENRREAGQYLLTGSQNLALAEKVTESLAGRGDTSPAPAFQTGGRGETAGRFRMGTRTSAGSPCPRRSVERLSSRRVSGTCFST